MRRWGKRRPIALIAVAAALVVAVTASDDVAPSGPAIGTGGAATSVETLATQAAIDTLKAGGNAVDAAVTAAGVLGVTEPFSCGVGGGGFMVIRTADGKVTTIDGRETAPAAMTPMSFWENGVPLPFNAARWSGMSVGVPGTPATWADALEKYGTISLAEPSSGGSTVGEALNILEGYGLALMPRDEAFHYFLEASRYSFADRNAFLADPAYFDVPLSGLLSKDYAATRRALITPNAASPPVVGPGNPYPFVTGEASATATQSETTTHLVTSDKWGNVVSYTFTIESTGGSGLVVPGWGFLLNNELTDFNYDSSTHPNRVEGGKRPRSSMAPTIVLRDGSPFLALGSPGGSTIITTVLQILFDRVDEGMTLPQAIADPRASQRNTAATSAEPAFLASTLATQLQARRHAFTNGGEIGAAAAIEFLGGGNVLAAAEPVRRGGGSAMVVQPAP